MFFSKEEIVAPKDELVAPKETIFDLKEQILFLVFSVFKTILAVVSNHGDFKNLRDLVVQLPVLNDFQK